MASVTISPPDPNSFPQATLTPMGKTVLLLFTAVVFKSWMWTSCSQTWWKPIVKRLWLCTRLCGQLQQGQVPSFAHPHAGPLGAVASFSFSLSVDTHLILDD